MPVWESATPSAPALLRNQVRWLLPPDLPPGRFELGLAAGAELIMLGTVTSTVPDRRFTRPDVPLAINRPIGFARLLGAELGSREMISGKPFELILYWESEAETRERYRVFVHLRDETGAVRTQSDGEPAEWTRPTTGWLAGEIIADRHVLFPPPDLPPGEYTLVAGLYPPAGAALGEAVVVTRPVKAR